MQNKNKIPSPYAVARVLPGDRERLKEVIMQIEHNDYIFAFHPDQDIMPLIEAMN